MKKKQKTLVAAGGVVAAAGLAVVAVRGPSAPGSAEQEAPLDQDGTRETVGSGPSPSSTPASGATGAGAFCLELEPDPWFSRVVICPEHGVPLVPISDRGIRGFRPPPAWGVAAVSAGEIPVRFLEATGQGLGEPEPLGNHPSRFCCPRDGRVWIAGDDLEVEP